MIVTIFTIIFLYTPLLLVAISSFNASKYGGAWTGFSLKWYQKLLFNSPDIWEALLTTLFIALVSTIFSTILGTMAALALYRSKTKFKGVYNSLIQTQLVVPDILSGISLLLLFVTVFALFRNWFGIDLQLGMTTIIIAHTTFCISYVAMVVLDRLNDFDHSMVEAAADLGASATYTFLKVTLPQIMPGIVAGALFAFMLSIDDFVITFFVKGAGDTTLPIYIQSAMRRGSPAVINALSVIFVVVTFILVFAAQKILTKNPESKQ